MERVSQTETLEKPLVIELKDENTTINATLRSKLFSSIKTKLLFIHKKITHLVSCTTSKTVDAVQELNVLEELEKVKEPIAVEVAGVIEKQIAIEVADVIEEPVSFNQRV